MEEIQITAEILDRARARAALQKNNKFSFTSHGKLYGLIAEEIFLSIYGGELKNTSHFDIELKTLGKIDIKTKSCKSAPLPEYTASVSDYQKGHQTDYYFFFRISTDLSKAWVLGGLSKDEFYRKATFVAKGTREGPFLCRVDMNSVLINELKTLKKLQAEHKK